MTRTRFVAPFVFVVSACASNPPPPPAAAAPVAAAPAAPAPAPAPAPAQPAAPGQPAAPAATAARPPQAILADAVQATGGAAAWNAHKTAHYRVETVFQGMAMRSDGERFATRNDKALTVAEVTGLGTVREGTNGKVAWTQDPLQGLRYLEGAEAEQSRLGASWNPEMNAAELFAKLESASEPGADGTALECVVATPRVGAPVKSCYDPRTHLQVSQSGIKISPQGQIPFRATVSDWRSWVGSRFRSRATSSWARSRWSIGSRASASTSPWTTRCSTRRRLRARPRRGSHPSRPSPRPRPRPSRRASERRAGGVAQDHPLPL